MFTKLNDLIYTSQLLTKPRFAATTSPFESSVSSPSHAKRPFFGPPSKLERPSMHADAGQNCCSSVFHCLLFDRGPFGQNAPFAQDLRDFPFETYDCCSFRNFRPSGKVVMAAERYTPLVSHGVVQDDHEGAQCHRVSG